MKWNVEGEVEAVGEEGVLEELVVVEEKAWLQVKPLVDWHLVV